MEWNGDHAEKAEAAYSSYLRRWAGLSELHESSSVPKRQVSATWHRGDGVSKGNDCVGKQRQRQEERGKAKGVFYFVLSRGRIVRPFHFHILLSLP